MSNTIETIIQNNETLYNNMNEIAKTQQRAYNKGMAEGQKSEYDKFWDSYQAKGYSTSYLCAFAGVNWTDSIYNPKYPIDASGNAQLMYYYSQITDTKVTIDISKATANLVSMFANAKSLVTIRKIIFGESNPDLTSLFTKCNALENITVEGVIAKSINLQWCPLSVESMKSIIRHLKDYKFDPEYEYKYTLTFNDDCWSRLEASGNFEGDVSWREYVEYILGWLTA